VHPDGCDNARADLAHLLAALDGEAANMAIGLLGQLSISQNSLFREVHG
jgi:hypothetical protein